MKIGWNKRGCHFKCLGAAAVMVMAAEGGKDKVAGWVGEGWQAEHAGGLPSSSWIW